VREQVTFPETSMEHALHDLVGHSPIKEAAIVSTCNRTEVYCSTDKPAVAMQWLADFHHLKTQELEPYLYMLSREKAVKHAIIIAWRLKCHQ
jgi:glutamyl-tRNA reductase